MTYTELHHQYVVLEKSVYAIAREFTLSPSKVSRLLRKYGIPRRTRSEATRKALEKGRLSHPTRGRPKTEEEKIRLSQTLTAKWKTISDEQRQALSDRMREVMNARPDKEQATNTAHERVREAAERGSKLERFLFASLLALGHQAEFHKTHTLIGAGTLELDIYLPSRRVAIEVNGPNHYRPVWGQERLSRTQASDARKAGLCRAAGIHLIIVKSSRSALTLAFQQQILAELTPTLSRLENALTTQYIVIGE